MQRYLRRIVASLLITGSISCFALTAALPAHAQVRQNACPEIQVTTGAGQQCVVADELPRAFGDVTQICVSDGAPLVLFRDFMGQATGIVPGTCESFTHANGGVILL